MANGQNVGQQLGLSPADQQRIRMAQAMQKRGMSGQNRTPLETIGNTLMNIRGQQQQEQIAEEQDKRRQAYADTMRNVATAGQQGVVTGPGGGGTGEVATPKQRMIDFLSANPDTAPTAAQMQLSQALQPEQARTQTISGDQANRMFGTQLSPGAAVTVEAGPQGSRITNVQEGQERPETNVNAQFQALNKETGERETLLRTNRGLVRQTIDEGGQARFEPVDSSQYRPVDTQEQGTSQELSGLGSTEQRKLRDQQTSAQNFIATTGDAIKLLQENPNINTWSARAQSTLNSMAQEAKALGLGGASLKDSDKDPLNPSQWQDEFGEMGIQSDRLRGIIQSLAFSLARSREGGRLSESDIRSAIKTVGTSSDPQSLATTMQDVANRVARRFRINYETRTGEEYEEDLGLSNLPSFSPQEGQGGQSGADVEFRLNENGELERVN